MYIYNYIYWFYHGQRQSQPSALINYLSIYLCINQAIKVSEGNFLHFSNVASSYV